MPRTPVSPAAKRPKRALSAVTETPSAVIEAPEAAPVTTPAALYGLPVLSDGTVSVLNLSDAPPPASVVLWTKSGRVTAALMHS